MRNFFSCALIALAAMATIALSTPAKASTVIFSFSGGTARSDGGIVSGFSFSTSSFVSFTVKSLGFYDAGDDGISGSYQVGLWDSSQNLLTSGTVTPASPLIGDFRWVNVAPVTLLASSSYVAAALLPNSPPDTWLDNATINPSAGFGGAGTGQFLASGTLTYPTSIGASPYVIVNVSDTAVPEPASLGILTASALTLIGRRSKRVD